MAQFKDIIGQDMIKEHLQNALTTQNVSHAYIINGERCSGKEFIATIFAMALQCEAGGNDPCMECHSCKQAMSKNHPDIIFVSHEKPNTVGVDDIRTQVNSDVTIKPYQGPKKIYIINEAEKMNLAAQNAILKTLEEPPEYAVIILLTSNLEAFLPTIISRCIVLNMKPVDDEKVKRFLMDELYLPDYKAAVCAAFSRGNIGKARLLASSEDFDKIKDEAVTLMKYMHEMEIQEVSQAVKRMTEYKLEINDFLDLLSVWYRDALLYKATKDVNHLIFKDEIQYIKKAATASTYEGIENVLDALDKAKKRLAANVSFELTMELLFLTIREN